MSNGTNSRLFTLSIFPNMFKSKPNAHNKQNCSHRVCAYALSVQWAHMSTTQHGAFGNTFDKSM